MFSKRQVQVAGFIQKEIGELFLLHAKEWVPGKMLTVTVVRMTKDLGIANIYISVFPSEKSSDTINLLNKDVSKIRFELGNRIKNHVRRIPELKFFLDDSLDYIEKIDQALKS
jgi:ribosome-binding factor A